MRKAEQDVEDTVREAGELAGLEVGVHEGHPEIVKLLGMVEYRYSYAQDVLTHSIEAAFVCGMIASEIGISEKQAPWPALVHDIGEALTSENEGSHATVGADLAKKYGESANAIVAHHAEVKAEAILASAAVRAGWEIRILVEPTRISDEEVATMAREVARWIEGEVTYQGQIKVTVAGEQRPSEFAQ